MNFNKNTGAVLEWLEDNIDDGHYERLAQRHIGALAFEAQNPPVAQINAPVNGLDPYDYAETYGDLTKMLYNELLNCVAPVYYKSDGFLGIRADYGVGTLASLFGAKDRITAKNQKPWAEPLSPREIAEALANGVPDLKAGHGGRVAYAYEYYRETLRKYPKCGKHIRLNHPDFQGPFDAAHLLMGDGIYYALYDDPGYAKALISLVTETYIAFYKNLKPLLTDALCLGGRTYVYQGGNIWGGAVVVRNDTSVNLSQEQYAEFAQPFDERIFDALGGGSIHFCGRSDQWIAKMFETRGLGGINYGYMPNHRFGQPLLDFIRPFMLANKVPVVGYFLSDGDLAGFDFKKHGAGVTFSTGATDAEDYKRKRDYLFY